MMHIITIKIDCFIIFFCSSFHYFFPSFNKPFEIKPCKGNSLLNLSTRSSITVILGIKSLLYAILSNEICTSEEINPSIILSISSLEILLEFLLDSFHYCFRILHRSILLKSSSYYFFLFSNFHIFFHSFF